ncbi:unnamed protein product [Prunus armeniaca]
MKAVFEGFQLCVLTNFICQQEKVEPPTRIYYFIFFDFLSLKFSSSFQFRALDPKFILGLSRFLCFSHFVDMEKVEPTLEVFYEEKKRVKNPWVPVGALLTAGVLTAGLISFRQGNSQLGQKLMRARVVAQGGTVALMVGSAYYYGENPWKKI